MAEPNMSFNFFYNKDLKKYFVSFPRIVFATSTALIRRYLSEMFFYDIRTENFTFGKSKLTIDDKMKVAITNFIFLHHAVCSNNIDPSIIITNENSPPNKFIKAYNEKKTEHFITALEHGTLKFVEVIDSLISTPQMNWIMKYYCYEILYNLGKKKYDPSKLEEIDMKYSHVDT